MKPSLAFIEIMLLLLVFQGCTQCGRSERIETLLEELQEIQQPTTDRKGDPR